LTSGETRRIGCKVLKVKKKLFVLYVYPVDKCLILKGKHRGELLTEYP
jgi:hypothetical protein